VRASGTGESSACTDPAGHRFLCIHCGSEATRPGVVRWLAPAAFSALSAAVAVAVTMIVVRPGPQTPAPALVAQRSRPAAVPSSRGPENGWVTESPRRPADDSGSEKASYLSLRDQVLRQGVESWPLPASSVVLTEKAKHTAETPITHQEQLSRLLDEQGLRGS
jgi:hypothetical protein